MWALGSQVIPTTDKAPSTFSKEISQDLTKKLMEIKSALVYSLILELFESFSLEYFV